MKNILKDMTKDQLILLIKDKENVHLQKDEIISNQKELLSITEKKLAESEEKLTKSEAKVENLQFQLSQLQKMLFGVKKERFIPTDDSAQLTLPFEHEPQEQTEDGKTVKETIEYQRKKSHKNHPGRFPLPSHLPVNEILIEPEESTEGLKLIGKDITEELEYTPAKLYINRYIRPKYAKEKNQGVIVAKLPSRPIEKGIAGPGLLASIHVNKFVYHLPIDRQVKQFKQEGVIIPANTINGWQERVALLLEPLYIKQGQIIVKQGYVQADETPIRVLDKNKKGTTHRGYFWLYHSPIQKAVYFDYQSGRGREGPTKFLKDFKGYLQTDGYVAYDYFATKEGITLIHCMAHARRYFVKAADYDRKAAEFVLSKIQLLYRIERFARNANFNFKELKDFRLEYALPIINEIGKWMAENYKNYPNKSPMKEALDYTIPRWDNLMAYLYDGALEIDNNLIENAVRPCAIGRKNYLFAGSHNGAKRAAMWYTFFGTCAKNNVNPYKWLTKVLTIISDYPVNKIEDLLPQNLKLDD